MICFDTRLWYFTQDEENIFQHSKHNGCVYEITRNEPVKLPSRTSKRNYATRLSVYEFIHSLVTCLNKYFRKNRVHGGKVLVPSMCENQRRNNNLTSWKRNVKISWNYHENNFTWGEIVASIDKKQINSYDLTKHVHACFSRDIFCVDAWREI